MMVWLLFIIDLMGLFFYNKIGSIISIGDLPTTNIIEPKKEGECLLFYIFYNSAKSLISCADIEESQRTLICPSAM